jgi:hypothetical protein
MSQSSYIDSCPCPNCGVLSKSISHYKIRVLKHYALGRMETKTYSSLRFRCKNSACVRKSFVHYPLQEGLEELKPRSRYTQSSKFFLANKMLSYQISDNSLQTQLREDFGSSTSISTLHTWTGLPLANKVAVVNIDNKIEDIKVLHTDEKHPSKKKSKQ